MIESEHGVVCAQATVARDGRIVVADVSLAVAPGQALAVIGRSGAGKSSLLAALATVLPLQEGDIRIDGHSVRAAANAVRLRIGYVPAGITAWPHARADEFLELFASEAGLSGKPLRLAVEKGLAMAGIEAAATAVDSLPAGIAKRLLIARALLHAPHVLIADDPFAALDPAERGDVEHLITDMHLGGRIVIAAIDDGIVPGCFTHLATLSAGRLVACGPALREAFDGGHTWGYRITSRGNAAEAAAALRRLAVDARVIDDDTVACRHLAGRLPFAELVSSLVRAGLPVESAGLHPHWTVQLIDDLPGTPHS